MIKVSELSGAWLDYWVARAEGFEAALLEVRQIQRSEDFHCVHIMDRAAVLNYSASWALCGPLIDKHLITLDWMITEPIEWRAEVGGGAYEAGEGPTALTAICRAVVQTKFGKEVPEVTP